MILRIVRALCSITAIALGACFPSVSALEIPSGGARSILLVEGTTVTALDLGEQGTDSIVIPRRSAAVYALQYRCPLEIFGLDPGPIPAHEGGEGLPLYAPPLAIYRAIEATGEIEPLFAFPRELENLRLERGTPLTPCVELLEQPIDVSDTDAIELAVPLEGDLALIALANGEFFTVSAEGLTPIMLQSNRPLPFRAGFRSPVDQKLWLTGRDGIVAAGTIDGLFTRAASRTATAGDYTKSALIGPLDRGAPFELYFSGGDQVIEYFDGTRWSLIVDRPGTPEGGAQLAWIDATRTIAVGFATPAHFILSRGAVSEETLPNLIEGEIPVSVIHADRLGTIIGGSKGSLYRNAAKIDTQSINPTFEPLWVLAPIDAGLLFGGEKGVLAQWYPNFGFCPAANYSEATFLRLIPLENSFLAIDRALFDQRRIALTLLHRRGPATQSCLGPAR